MSRLDDIRAERLRKITKLQELSINPYPQYTGERTDIATAKSSSGAHTLTGRLTARRGHGKLIFADLEDFSGQIQLMLKADVINPQDWQIVDLLDVGDFIAVSGEITTSQSGEISLLVSGLQLLSKSIRPLPEKWHGLTDVEERYRQRYVDLVVNPEVRRVFVLRTQILTAIRSFLDQHGFLEVETPVLQPLYGGATAKPFVTHHNALDSDLYLRISDELYLKRLIVGGFEKVYEVAKDFRNEGMSREHNPEFTMVEFYWAYVDYNTLMDFTQDMLRHILQTVFNSLTVTHQGKQYDFSQDLPRVPFRDLLLEYLKLDIDQVTTEEQLIDLVKQNNWLPPSIPLAGYGKILDELYKHHVRPHLDEPMFLIDYPTEMLPLAKRKDTDPSKIASFQLLIAGHEYIKAYNELNDPIDQAARWQEEEAAKDSGAEEFQETDHDYLRALEYGMPPTAGWGMGIDRIVAFLTDQPTLKDVILFPTLRPEA